MRLISIIWFLLLGLSTVTGAEQNSVGLPNEIPFKKSLTLTSVLLFDSPQENPELVNELGAKLTQYAVLESRAKAVLNPLVMARKQYKQMVSKTVFKNKQDLEKLMAQIRKETDEDTAHNISELLRDHLIQFDENVEPVSTSAQYSTILELAKQYQRQQTNLKKHPLFGDIEEARKELKVLMHEFLHKNYSTIQQLQEDFNVPLDKVNTFLNARQTQ